jgi:KDO2-lipid IV(A) lauroyltransferase
MKDFQLRLEAGLVWLAYHFFRLVPLDLASSIGGWLGRAIGPHLPVSRRARENLLRALPDLDPAPIIRAMWDNLGRSAAEFPHADQISVDPARLQVTGAEHLDALRQGGAGALLFSGHLGNWELSYALGARAGLRVNPVYRAPDNPYVRWLFESRVRSSEIELIPKGPRGARQTIRLLSKGELIAMFVDQKMNDGIEVPFFGRPAMTAPALASLALKFDRPVIPFRIIRLKGAHFRAEVAPPFRFATSQDRASDVAAGMARVNQILEGWIREHPAQWLWLHRRWPKDQA